jgi:hypothetical protein
MDQGLKRAKYYWQKYVAALADGKLIAEEGPWLLADDVPLEVFEQWNRNQESRWRLSWQPYPPPDDMIGCVMFYGDPSVVHDAVAEWLVRQVDRQLFSMGGEAAADAVLVTGSATCTLVNMQRKVSHACQRSDSYGCNCELIRAGWFAGA